MVIIAFMFLGLALLLSLAFPIIGLIAVLVALGFAAMPIVRVVLFWMAFIKNSKSVGTKDRSLGVDKDSRWCLSTFFIVSLSINILVLVSFGVAIIWAAWKYDDAMKALGPAATLMGDQLVRIVGISIMEIFWSIAIWSWAKEGDEHYKPEDNKPTLHQDQPYMN